MLATIPLGAGLADHDLDTGSAYLHVGYGSPEIARLGHPSSPRTHAENDKGQPGSSTQSSGINAATAQAFRQDMDYSRDNGTGKQLTLSGADSLGRRKNRSIRSPRLHGADGYTQAKGKSAMAMTTHVDIVSIEESLFSGPVEYIVAPAVMGEVCIYPMHAPMLTHLDQELFG